MIRGGRDKGSISVGENQSWRSLAGTRRRSRVESPQARRRRQMQRLKKASVLFIVLLVISGAIYGGVVLFQRGEPIEIGTPSKPIEQIIFDTDGVLPDRWLGSVIELRKGTTMMEVDIHEIKRALEAEGQVRSASVQREFPHALKIQIREHEPVLRMRVMGALEVPELRIVSREGTFYKGVGYPEATLRKLPYLVPYRHPEGGIRPLQGIPRVAELLEVTRRTQPDFFRTWQLVSLEHYSGDPDMPGEVIEVRSSMVPRILFGVTTDFAQQLDRLGVILQFVQSRGNPAVKRIDLSLQGSASVQFESGRISTF